jgi:hypothetical protein
LQCVLAAKILTVYFVVYTLAVKKNQGRFRHVGSDHSLVSWAHSIELVRRKGLTLSIGLNYIGFPEDGGTVQSPKRCF